jgi:hypothetical protein
VRRALTLLVCLGTLVACATLGPPPGGPTVSSFPRVILTLPDTNAVNVRPNKVMLRYDDVIGEQANGGELSSAVIISPWDGEPRVEWKRTGMTIRPNGAWRTNTAYTITVLPGIGDLRGQPSPFGYVMQFSTGPSIPKTALRGVVFDYVLAKPLPKATVFAVSATDSTNRFLTVSDSTGRFELTAVPAGRYLLRAIDEKTVNRELDSREAWDTVTVALTDSARSDLYVFVHDTLPVRLNDPQIIDSVTIALPFDKPLKAGITLAPSAVRVARVDSTLLNVVSVSTRAGLDSARAREDSVARLSDTTKRAADGPVAPRRTIDPNQRRDTAAVVPLPKSARPAPVSELVLRLGTPLVPGATYRITLSGVQNLLGIATTTSRQLSVPKPEPRDSTQRTPGGRRAAPPRTPPDSTRPPRPAFRRD